MQHQVNARIMVLKTWNKYVSISYLAPEMWYTDGSPQITNPYGGKNSPNSESWFGPNGLLLLQREEWIYSAITEIPMNWSETDDQMWCQAPSAHPVPGPRHNIIRCKYVRLSVAIISNEHSYKFLYESVHTSARFTHPLQNLHVPISKTRAGLALC